MIHHAMSGVLNTLNTPFSDRRAVKKTRPGGVSPWAWACVACLSSDECRVQSRLRVSVGPGLGVIINIINHGSA